MISLFIEIHFNSYEYHNMDQQDLPTDLPTYLPLWDNEDREMSHRALVAGYLLKTCSKNLINALFKFLKIDYNIDMEDDIREIRKINEKYGYCWFKTNGVFAFSNVYLKQDNLTKISKYSDSYIYFQLDMLNHECSGDSPDMTNSWTIFNPACSNILKMRKPVQDFIKNYEESNVCFL